MTYSTQIWDFGRFRQFLAFEHTYILVSDGSRREMNVVWKGTYTKFSLWRLKKIYTLPEEPFCDFLHVEEAHNQQILKLPTCQIISHCILYSIKTAAVINRMGIDTSKNATEHGQKCGQNRERFIRHLSKAYLARVIEAAVYSKKEKRIPFQEIGISITYTGDIAVEWGSLLTFPRAYLFTYWSVVSDAIYDDKVAGNK